MSVWLQLSVVVFWRYHRQLLINRRHLFCTLDMKRRRIDSESDSDARDEEAIASSVSGRFFVGRYCIFSCIFDKQFFLVSNSFNSTNALKNKASDVQSKTLELLKKICTSLDESRREQFDSDWFLRSFLQHYANSRHHLSHKQDWQNKYFIRNEALY